MEDVEVDDEAGVPKVVENRSVKDTSKAGVPRYKSMCDMAVSL